MITVKLKGGLGNQLFQYAFGRAISLKLETPLRLDLSHYKSQEAKDTNRYYQLDKFHIQADITDFKENGKIKTIHDLFKKIKSKIKNTASPYSNYAFNPDDLNVKDESILEGFWQSEKYFKDIEMVLRHDLRIKDKLGTKAAVFKDRIKQVKDHGGVSASLHIRRGDYVTNKYANVYHGLLDLSYYQRAISTIQAKLCHKPLVLFIFSDDIAWVKENLKTETPYVCVSRPEIQDHEELLLMSLCDHNIIANSSFSWWGAWLNASKNKIVVAPKNWVKDPLANTSDVVPFDWIRV